MAIGCGCFLIRPIKPSPPGDGEPSPPTSSRGEVENPTDSATRSSLSEVVPSPEMTTEKENPPPGNVTAAAGTADDGAGPPTRSSSMSSDQATTLGAVSGGGDNHREEGEEASVPRPVAANGEGTTKNEENTPATHEIEDSENSTSKDDSAESMETTKVSTAEVEVEVEAGLKPSTPTNSVDSTTAKAGDDQTDEVGLGGVDDEQPTPDAASDRNSMVGGDDENSALDLTENPVLNALLSDMTRAADAWASASAARLTGAGNQERVAKVEAPGCTAIVILDAPLITPDLHPRPGFLRKKSETQTAGPQPESLDQERPAARESSETDAEAEAEADADAEVEATVTLSDDGAASSRGSRSSEVASTTTVKATNLDEPSDGVDEEPGMRDGDGDNGVVLSEQHPAGLGDPGEALERLLGWIGEGESSGCGRREILLVCCGDSPALSSEERRRGSFSGDVSETPTTAREDMASARGPGDNVTRKLLDVQPDKKSGDEDNSGVRSIEATVRANDVDVILPGEDGAEGGVADGSEGRSSGGDGEHNDRPTGTIRQIILGGTTPIEVVPQQPASEETDSDPHQTDRNERKTETMKVPSVVVGLRNRRKNNNNSRSNDDDTSRKPTTTQPAPSRVHLPPSEVLLQTRPAAPTGGGLSRVAVAFPPPTIIPPGDLRATREETKMRSSETISEEPFPGAGDSADSFDDSVRVVVGPVIGRVGPNSGIVLVEVDSVAPSATRREEVAQLHVSDGVGVRLTDTLTGRTHQMTGGTWTGGQPGEGPRVFEFEGLAPGRRYALRLSGVRQRDQVRVRPG